MAARYWVNNGGTWTDTAHWSETSGGASGASAPTSTDDAYFDANSFSSDSQTVRIYTGVCRDMIWDGVTNTPRLLAGFGDSLEVYGTFKLDPNMTLSISSMNLYLKGAGNHEIWTRNKTLFVFTLYMQATGTYTVMDKLAVGSVSPERDFEFHSGTLDMNGKIMDTRSVEFHGSDPKVFMLEGATISFKGDNSTWDETTGSNITFVANELTNIETSNNSATTLTWRGNGNVFGGSINIKDTQYNETLKIYGDNTFHSITIQGHIANAGVKKALLLEAGKTQNVTSFFAQGTSIDYVTIDSLTAGSQGILRKTFGSSVCDYISIKDCQGTGGALWWAGEHSQDRGNTS